MDTYQRGGSGSRDYIDDDDNDPTVISGGTRLPYYISRKRSLGIMPKSIFFLIGGGEVIIQWAWIGSHEVIQVNEKPWPTNWFDSDCIGKTADDD